MNQVTTILGNFSVY